MQRHQPYTHILYLILSLAPANIHGEEQRTGSYFLMVVVPGMI